MMRPSLILLPGLDGTTRLLDTFIDAVRPSFASVDAIAYPHDIQMDYAALETYARARLPKGSPFVLLGESFSGPVAIAIAADPPTNLVGLVLSTTFARAPVAWLSIFAPLTRFAPVRTLPTILLSMILLGRWHTPELRSELRDALHDVSPVVLRARAASAMRADVVARLAHIAVPTLCLRARQDRLLRPRTVQRLAADIPGARESVLDGPHLLLQTRTTQAADIIVRFAADLAGC